MGYLSPPPLPAAVVVYKDVGGLVSDYEARTAQYKAENREVRLHECRSACTLALSLPNVCVYPDAKVKFHQAYNAITREVDLDVSARLFSSYPAAVQARLGYLTREYRVLSGVELIALGLRNCNETGRVMVAGADRRQGTHQALVKRPGFVAPVNPLDAVTRDILATLSGGAAPLGEDASAGNIRAVPPGGAGSVRAFVRGAGNIRALPVAGAGVALASAVPLPPRRPSAADFSMKVELAAYPVLMSGARPILDSARFTPVR